jgi:hypothetical protein
MLTSYTPPGALFAPSTLKIHRPTIPPSPLSLSGQEKKIPIWGGSSAMGSLSISYAKAAGYTVHKLVAQFRSFAQLCCRPRLRSQWPGDYRCDSQSLPHRLLVRHRCSQTSIKILAPEGGPVARANILMLLPLVMTGMRAEDFPEGVTTQFFSFRRVHLKTRSGTRTFLHVVTF